MINDLSWIVNYVNILLLHTDAMSVWIFYFDAKIFINPKVRFNYLWWEYGYWTPLMWNFDLEINLWLGNLPIYFMLVIFLHFNFQNFTFQVLYFYITLPFSYLHDLSLLGKGNYRAYKTFKDRIQIVDLKLDSRH